MRILLTGATGFIGTPLCNRLADAGHELVVLSRNAAAAKETLPIASETFEWPEMTALPPAEAFEGVEAVIHLAGESVSGRWDEVKKRRVRDSRVNGTRSLVSVVEKLDQKPNLLISASAIGYYGDRGDDVLPEDVPPGDDFFAEVCSAWEREAQRAREFGLRVVNPRIGIVLGPDGGALGQMLPMAKLGLNGPLGSGQQWWAWVHRDDVIGLIVHALNTQELEGPVNATAPNPLRQAEFAKVLGKILHRPAFLPVPAFALKLMLGEFSNELLSSKRTLSKKAQDAGYSFKFPELEEALREVLDREKVAT